jgi:Fe-S cluster assembly iron-binding protein IscA
LRSSSTCSEKATEKYKKKIERNAKKKLRIIIEQKMTEGVVGRHHPL